jgi:hypothetical protein
VTVGDQVGRQDSTDEPRDACYEDLHGRPPPAMGSRRTPGQMSGRADMTGKLRNCGTAPLPFRKFPLAAGKTSSHETVAFSGNGHCSAAMNAL